VKAIHKLNPLFAMENSVFVFSGRYIRSRRKASGLFSSAHSTRLSLRGFPSFRFALLATRRFCANGTLLSSPNLLLHQRSSPPLWPEVSENGTSDGTKLFRLRDAAREQNRAGIPANRWSEKVPENGDNVL